MSKKFVVWNEGDIGVAVETKWNSEYPIGTNMPTIKERFSYKPSFIVSTRVYYLCRTIINMLRGDQYKNYSLLGHTRTVHVPTNFSVYGIFSFLSGISKFSFGMIKYLIKFKMNRVSLIRRFYHSFLFSRSSVKISLQSPVISTNVSWFYTVLHGKSYHNISNKATIISFTSIPFLSPSYQWSLHMHSRNIGIANILWRDA
jgi:hypothetical protein